MNMHKHTHTLIKLINFVKSHIAIIYTSTSSASVLFEGGDIQDWEAGRRLFYLTAWV